MEHCSVHTITFVWLPAAILKEPLLKFALWFNLLLTLIVQLLSQIYYVLNLYLFIFFNAGLLQGSTGCLRYRTRRDVAKYNQEFHPISDQCVAILRVMSFVRSDLRKHHVGIGKSAKQTVNKREGERGMVCICVNNSFCLINGISS